MVFYDNSNDILRKISRSLDTIAGVTVFIFLLLIILTVLLVINVIVINHIRLYKMHTMSLRERYLRNSANSIHSGGRKATSQSTASV